MSGLPRKILKIISAPAERLFHIFKYVNAFVEYRNKSDVEIKPRIEEDIDYEVIKNGVCTVEDFYLLSLILLRQQKYLYQEGLPAWHEKEEYYKGSKVKIVTISEENVDYKEYISQQDNNIGHNPLEDTSGIYWKLNSGSSPTPAPTPTPSEGGIVETIVDEAGNSAVVFSNGFCIQCFKPFDSEPAVTQSITFLKPFRDTNYSAQFTIVHVSGYSGAAAVEIVDARTVNSVSYYHKGGKKLEAIIMGFVATD